MCTVIFWAIFDSFFQEQLFKYGFLEAIFQNLFFTFAFSQINKMAEINKTSKYLNVQFTTYRKYITDNNKVLRRYVNIGEYLRLKKVLAKLK